MILAIPFFYFLPALLSACLTIGVKALLASKPSKDTKHLLILGSKGAGKTTLWNQLHKFSRSQDNTPTDFKDIKSFDVVSNEGKIRISSTQDIGGGDLYVKNIYEDLIKEDGTFIYYLVDLTKLSDFRNETRSRLQKISYIISEKKLMNCGCKILVTHLDEYEKSGHQESAKEYALRTLDLKSIKNIKIKIDESILPVNLLDKYDIEKIKREIIENKN